MTKQEKLIVTAYTGICMVNFDDSQEYVEQKLGRQVWTHELASEELTKELKAKVRDEFIELCKKED